ncbi:MAG: RNA polymerase sigma factor [Burkholderiaceae bacterium]
MPPSPSVEDPFLRELQDLMPRLWRFGLVLTKDPVAAEETTQNACLRAIERRDQFKAGTHLDRWVMTIMRSIWLNEQRAKQIRERDAEQLADRQGRQTDGQSGERMVFVSEVLTKIEALPEWQRVALLLVGVEQFSLREAAEILEIPEGTLASRLARAREALRSDLADALPLKGGPNS